MRLRIAAASAGIALVATACSGGTARSSGQPSPDGLAAVVASFDLAVGPPARFLVGLYSNDQRGVAYGDVQVRFAYLGTRQSSTAGGYGPPTRARFLPAPGSVLPAPEPTAPQYVTGSDVKGVYRTQAGFPKAGFYRVEVTAAVGGKARTATSAFTVQERHAVPAPGDAALPTENLTMSSTDAPMIAIDSQAGVAGEIPDPALHEATIAGALAAHRPAVVVFATPAFCQSRFCGPVTDMVAGLVPTYADRATFIHVEIWRDFQSQTLNPAAAEWLFREGDLNEPWVFVIGADGRITARFDNVVSAGELKAVLDPLPAIGPAT